MQAVYAGLLVRNISLTEGATASGNTAAYDGGGGAGGVEGGGPGSGAVVPVCACVL